MKTNHEIFHVRKVAEGGIGQKEGIRLLKANGIKARPDYSPYVGHTAFEVSGTKAEINQASKLIFGR